MTQEQRSFLALLLSFVVIFGWAYWMQKNQAEKAMKNPIKPIPKENVKPEPPPQEKLPVPPDHPPVPKENPVAPSQKEEEFVVETEKYRMSWSNIGGALRSLKLKEFYHGYVDRKEKDWARQPENWLELMPEFSERIATFCVDLPKESGIDMKAQGWKVTQQENPKRLIFEIGPIQGIKYSKIFTFHEKEYRFDGELLLENQSEQSQAQSLRMITGSGVALESHDTKEIAQTVYGYAMATNEKKQRMFESYNYGDFYKENKTVDQNIAWTALVNRYFGHVLHISDPGMIISASLEGVPPSQRWVSQFARFYRMRKETVDESSLKNVKIPVWWVYTKPIVVPPRERVSFKFVFRADTKLNLSGIHGDYRILDDYGFFGIISYVLLAILRFFYSIFQNYGVAIIFLTLLIKFCLFPLTRKQQMSMRDYQQKIQKVQPQMKKLQEKYKSDRQRLNQEIMKLYKDYNINPIPLGGCLPIFLQIPIFIGLYQGLYYSIMLRQAGFLWIDDLSQPDRLCHFGSNVWLLGDYLNILPIIMTIVWIVQQKMTPKPEDPQMQQQQKMFMYMSIVFGFLFYHVASGLVLYWLVMNLFGIAEQMIIKKNFPQKA